MAIALKALRDARGMSDTEVWAAAGLSSATMSRYLHGTRGSTAIDRRGAETIERLAAVFGVPPDYFIEYRAWKVREIARKYPALADEVYDLLVAHAASEESRRRSRGK